MNKKMNIMLAIIIIEAIIIGVLAVMIFQGQDYEKARFIGKWVSTGGFNVTYEFYKDGSCLINNIEKGTWEINNGKLSIITNYGRHTQTNAYGFSLDIGGSIFTKQ